MILMLYEKFRKGDPCSVVQVACASERHQFSHPVSRWVVVTPDKDAPSQMMQTVRTCCAFEP